MLKDNKPLRERLKGELATILNNLDEVDEQDAVLFLQWTREKSCLYRDALLHAPYPFLPDAMERGDIVLCKLGVNVPPEMSDQGTGRHFVVIWGQQGHNLLVIPITQRAPSRANPYVIALGAIPGIPAAVNYAKLDAIRSVSLRRIGRLYNAPGGKLNHPPATRIIADSVESLLIDKLAHLE